MIPQIYLIDSAELSKNIFLEIVCMWLETVFQGYVKCMINWRMVSGNQDVTICFIKGGYALIYSQICNMYQGSAVYKALCQAMWGQIYGKQDESDQDSALKKLFTL